jgi:hypothetical protein
LKVGGSIGGCRISDPGRRGIAYKKNREMLFVTPGCHFDRGKGVRENLTVRAGGPRVGKTGGPARAVMPVPIARFCGRPLFDN